MSVFFKQPSMKAWALFKSSASFALQHPIFSIIFLLITLGSACIQQIFMAAAATARAAVETDPLKAALLKSSTLFKIPQAYQDMLSTPYGIGMLWGARVLLVLLSFSLVFYVQSLLRHKNTSFLIAVEDSFYAIIKAPWIFFLLLVQSMALISLRGVMANTFWYITLVFMHIMIMIPLCYAQPLIYDHHYQFTTVLRMSWNYLKESWFVLFKYFMLGMVAMWFFSLSGYFLIWYFKLELPLTMVEMYMAIGFIWGLISHIAMNKIYCQLRLFKHS